MSTINTKGQHELTQEQALFNLQNYLGAFLVKKVVEYEEIIYSHAQHLDFTYQKVPIQTHLPTKQEIMLFPSLFKDSPVQNVAYMSLIRILQYENKLICLALDSDMSDDEQHFYLLAVVFQNKQAALAWRTQYSFLVQIIVSEPFKTFHKISMHAETVIFITRPENIRVQAKFKSNIYTPEQVRVQGNNRFKQRRFKTALREYQLGLGLIYNPDNKRERAILYANSSQCFFELRLFEAALAYASISVTIDKTYAKGFYRKFMCFLQLNYYKQVPLTLRAMSDTCSSEQFQKAESVYYRYQLNHHGIFDWKQLFSGAHFCFGEYFSPKLKKQINDNYSKLYQSKSKQSYVVTDSISKYELIMLSKPLVYKSSSQIKNKQNYILFLQEMVTSYYYQDSFGEKVQDLPVQHKLNNYLTLNYKPVDPYEEIEMHECHKKCLRCLTGEKLLTAPGEIKKDYSGIWSELHHFKQECMSNCTYIHIKGGLALFAVKNIKPGEELTVDFLNWQISKRTTTMFQRSGLKCDCPFCKWDWQEDIDKHSGQRLYSVYKHFQKDWSEHNYQKIALFYLWNLIYIKKYKETQLIKDYLLILEKYPLWECILNCLKYLKERPKSDSADLIKSVVKKLFQKYFKMSHSQAVQLLKSVL